MGGKNGISRQESSVIFLVTPRLYFVSSFVCSSKSVVSRTTTNMDNKIYNLHIINNIIYNLMFLSFKYIYINTLL